MRKWTDKQQQQLDELLKAKEHAEDRLTDDIDALVKDRTDYDRQLLHVFLSENGQAVLDMLLVHFEPSPQPTTLTPLGMIAKKV